MAQSHGSKKMHHRVRRETSPWVRSGVAVVAAMLFICISVFSGASENAPYSSEMYFTDASSRGLQIIPASGGSGATAPTLHAVQCDYNGSGTARLSWDAVSGASNYYVSYRNSPIGCNGWPSLNPSNPYECDNHGVTTTYADITIAYDYPYDWWVHSVVGGAVSSPSQASFSCPSIPSACVPSSYCGISVLSDCSTTGSYDSSLPGCSATPSGCGAGTLNDTCADEEITGECPVGYVLSGNTCVFDQCPSGWQRVGNSCVLSQCPYGYVLQGTECVAGCPAQYFYCGTGANTGTLYKRSYSAAPACTASDLVYAQCEYGCNASRGACNPTPESNASISARPQLVRQGTRTDVSWNATSINSCVVTGTNGDEWSCTGSACTNRTEESRPITTQTTYMLTCAVTSQPNIVKTVTVNILPVFIEQ